MNLRLLTLFLIMFFPLLVRAELIERIVAIVNDDIITQTDVDKYEEKLSGQSFTDDLLIPDEATKQALIKNRDRLLQTMIDEKIIDSEIKRQKLETPIERVEQEIRSIAKRNGLSRDELKAAIEEKGMRFSAYQDFIRSGIERHSLIDKAIVQKIKISEDDVLAQYQTTHADQVDQNFEYTIEHILFLVERAGLPQARSRAEFVLKKIRDGGSFETLAGEYSEDPNFTSGGLLGTFKTGEMSKELEVAVQKLSVGETSGLVQTKAGVHILKIAKKRPIPDPKIEKAKDEIRDQLYAKSYKRQFQSWLEQIRQEAFVRINRVK